MTEPVRRRLGDPDANVVYPITDATGENVDWASPQVKAKRRDTTVTISCTWLGSAAPTRSLRVPLSTLTAGTHELELVVPGDNDCPLGSVTLR